LKVILLFYFKKKKKKKKLIFSSQRCGVGSCEDRAPSGPENRCYVDENDTCAYLVDGSSANGKCGICPALHYNNVNGVCVLKECGSRYRNDSARYVCGSLDCVYNGTGCGAYCLPNSAPDGKGICSDPTSPCGQKTPLLIETNKCGEGCVYVEEEDVCSNACQQFFINDSLSGACIPSSCEERLPNMTLSFDFCGPNCVQTSNSECGSVCPSSTVLDPVTKRCKPEINCLSVMYNPDVALKCGEYCVYDVTTQSCNDTCPSYYKQNINTGMCEPLECEARAPNTNSNYVCGPFPCFQTLSSCGYACAETQAPDSRGVCGYATLSDRVEVNGTQTLDNALNSKLSRSITNPTIYVASNSSLNNGADMTGVMITGLPNFIPPTVDVTSSVTLDIKYNSSNSFKPTSIVNVQFNLNLLTITSSLIRCVGTTQSTLVITGVIFTYRPRLYAPLISINAIGILQISNTSINKMVGNLMSNADESNNICGMITDGPALLIKDSEGMITSTSFRNVDSGKTIIMMCIRIMYVLFIGAIMLVGSQISLSSVSFVNNSIQRLDAFPNLRHNIYVANGSVINITNLVQDTGICNFIYVADDNVVGGSVVDGVVTPLFIPRISSASPPQLSSGIMTQFVFSGSNFYPCGLRVSVYKGGEDNQILVW
jgi:hypothetical protein